MGDVEEPSIASGPEGNMFLPVHALDLQEEQLVCHGLLFARLDGESWSMLESLRMRDQEMDSWLNKERVFAIMPFTGSITEVDHPAFLQALQRYAEVVTAARLVAPGVWIDSHHLAPVARTDDGINVRMISSDRPRLWASVFGEALKVQGRRREWENRVECRPLQFHLPHGPAYTMDGETATLIESTIGVLNELRTLVPNHAWWIAQAAYQRGNDVFLSRRLRLTALFGAFEAIFGPFRREKHDPGIGVAVQTALKHMDPQAESPAKYVESNLRAARNRLAHGSDVAMPVDLATAEEDLLYFLRLGLALSSLWIRGRRQADGPIAPGAPRTLIEFQRWLGRVVVEEH